MERFWTSFNCIRNKGAFGPVIIDPRSFVPLTYSLIAGGRYNLIPETSETRVHHLEGLPEELHLLQMETQGEKSIPVLKKSQDDLVCLCPTDFQNWYYGRLVEYYKGKHIESLLMVEFLDCFRQFRVYAINDFVLGARLQQKSILEIIISIIRHRTKGGEND